MSRDTKEKKRCFVENLKRLMVERGYTPRETAKRAGIEDVKRFYRWASVGISRATHEHDGDLQKLCDLFRLASIGQLWNEAKPSTLAERLRDAGKVSWEYEMAHKLLVVLRASGGVGRHHPHTKNLCSAIEAMFSQATQENTVEEVLRPKNAEEIVAHVQINYAEAYAGLMGVAKGDRTLLVQIVADWEREHGSKFTSPEQFLEVLVRNALVAAQNVRINE